MPALHVSDEVPPTDAAGLLELARRGDIAAQDRLVRWMAPIIRRAIGGPLSLSRLPLTPDDLVQDATLRVLLALPAYRGGADGALVAWVRHVSRSTLVDAVRRQSAHKRGERLTDSLDDAAHGPLAEVLAEVPAHSPESVIDRQARLALLWRALLQLDERDRQVIILAAEGHSHVEIAAALGCSSEAARKRLGRGQAQLRDLLGAVPNLGSRP